MEGTLRDVVESPSTPPPLSLVNAAAEAVVDESISIVPPTLPEVYAAIKKIKSGKSPGVCGVYPEYLHYAGPEAVRLLVGLFAQVWESEIVPDDWRQGIIVPIYKGKGSRSDCIIIEASLFSQCQAKRLPM